MPLAKVLIVLVVTVLATHEVFGFGFGGGGGGCGGGGGGCGGGCGRKKREVLGPQIRTEETSICPQADWKLLIEQNIDTDVDSTKFAVQRAFFEHYESKFFVSCAEPKPKVSPKFVSNGEGYCIHGNEKIQCTVVALYG
ncbi:hypothetical protein AAVH_40054 [Aphelenchoides avenae]|nr:hypothetical protein AAVH_40054 [Aphelenchus avenae]